MDTSISAFTAVRDILDRGCPFLETVANMIHRVDEWVVCDGFSKDGTWEMLAKMREVNPKIRLFQSKWTQDKVRGLAIGLAYESARLKCRTPWVVKVEADEIWMPGAIELVKEKMLTAPRINSYSVIYTTLSTWDYFRNEAGWHGWRCLIARRERQARVHEDGYNITWIPPLQKVKNTQVYNLGYVFPENILEKWKQNRELHETEPGMSGDHYDLTVKPEEYEFLPYMHHKVEKFDFRSILPDIVHPLLSMRRYVPRMELLDLIKEP
jgi:glycosyltransferase involved in cell wall biosynthesis